MGRARPPQVKVLQPKQGPQRPAQRFSTVVSDHVIAQVQQLQPRQPPQCPAQRNSTIVSDVVCAGSAGGRQDKRNGARMPTSGRAAIAPTDPPAPCSAW
mmetsp:Transcript_71974/g.192236  ORF Transcript_71974/g.192236 Transcript_71974/m.192236 type:complete len:99 (+) Transcript_71974:452-748(+)